VRKIFKMLIIFLIIFLPISGVVAKENDQITLYFFHGEGCPHCASEKKFLENIKDNYENLEIIEFEVWYNSQNAELLQKVQEALKDNKTGVPKTVIGNTIISGYGESTGSKIERAIRYYKDNEYTDIVKEIQNGTYVENVEEKHEEDKDNFTKQEEESDQEMTMKIPLFGKVNMKRLSLMSSAVIIGLIDGFNPCAMWILLFLISVLIGMKNRKRMWAIGLTFLISSALVYLLIMLSWVNVVVKITTIVWVRNIIAIVALIGASANLVSFFKSQDSGCTVVDDKKRKNVFKKIRKFTSEKSLILALLGVIGLAISVNLVELACSAGLPIVFSELLALNNVSSFMRFAYTLLYIVFFLLDDLVVFFIAMFTMKVTGISTKYNKYSHLLGGIIMLAIGILLLVKPEWLMFNF